MKNEVIQELCSKCKSCIDVCPCNVLGINEDDEVYFIPERISICQHCGQCMAVCRNKAIHTSGLSYGEDFFDLPGNKIDHQSFIDFLANRRSVRNFSDKTVSGETIQQLLESLAFAPYGADPEKMCVTVINNRKTIESSLPYFERFTDNVVQWMENPIASFMIKRKNNKEKYNTLVRS